MPIRKIFTIADTDAYPETLPPCDRTEIADLPKTVKQIVADLKSTLRYKLPKIADEPPTHDRAAYLAANQIGHTKRVVLLYLPPTNLTAAQEIVMINPSYTRLKEVPSGSKEQFRISTFFADQFRFSNRCYAETIRVDYQDEYWNQQSIELKELDAIAAQMGINFINGITPLDNGITPNELTAFAQNTNADHRLKTARDAYIYHDRQFDPNNPEFSLNPIQLEYISQFLSYRQSHPCLPASSMGENKTHEQALSQTPAVKFN